MIDDCCDEFHIFADGLWALYPSLNQLVAGAHLGD